jgi:hypothetical protein
MVALDGYEQKFWPTEEEDTECWKSYVITTIKIYTLHPISSKSEALNQEDEIGGTCTRMVEMINLYRLQLQSSNLMEKKN